MGGDQEQMLNILVVDSNKVYAKMVCEILNEQLRETSVDIAVNIWELRRRLKGKEYNLVLADLSLNMDGEEMYEELRSMEKSCVVLWSTLDKMINKTVMKKPTSEEALQELLPSLVRNGGVLA